MCIRLLLRATSKSNQKFPTRWRHFPNQACSLLQTYLSRKIHQACRRNLKVTLVHLPPGNDDWSCGVRQLQQRLGDGFQSEVSARALSASNIESQARQVQSFSMLGTPNWSSTALAQLLLACSSLRGFLAATLTEPTYCESPVASASARFPSLHLYVCSGLRALKVGLQI
jgi:hypothetical protein